MKRKPTPCLIWNPRVTEFVIPEPLAFTVGRPSGRNFGLPDDSELVGLHPGAGGIQINETVLQSGQVSRCATGSQRFIALLVPTVSIERTDLAVQKKAGLSHALHRCRLSLGKIQLGGRRRESHLSFE